MNYGDTLECVSSLLEINRNDYTIVIVDNSSHNESIKELQQYFRGNEKIHIIKAPSNLGYSGGNNMGIIWLTNKSIERIIIATNDTVLISKDILEKLDALELEDVGIVGPSLLSLDGTQQNPLVLAPSALYFANLFFYRQMRQLRSTLYHLFPAIERRRNLAVGKVRKTLASENAVSRPRSVYMLQGAFLYLTKSFIDQIGLLDDNIFMYQEEHLLSWQCEQHGLARWYVPWITVLHKERKSMESVYKNEKTKYVELYTGKSQQYITQKIGLFSFLLFLIKRAASTQ